MKISIIIPVYNVSDYIVRCLQSVARQECDAALECVLVDDCGHDDSVEKCRNFISDYEGKIQFRLEHHEKNRGLSAARNTGTRLASGDYLYYLDSDDEIAVGGLQYLVQAVQGHPEVEVVQGGVKSIPYSKFYDNTLYNDNKYVNDNLWIRKNFYSLDNYINVNAWNKLIKRDFLEQNGLFFYEGIIHEDQQWMFHVVKKLSKLFFVNQETYIHYSTPNSIMTSSSKKKSDLNWMIILNDVEQNLDSLCYQEQLVKYSFLLLKHKVWEFDDYSFLLSKYKMRMKKEFLFKGFLFSLAASLLSVVKNAYVQNKLIRLARKLLTI